MTSGNIAVDSAAKGSGEKSQEKLAEKRRALGRGLASLLPGPRVVPADPTLPQSARKDGGPAILDSLQAAASPPEERIVKLPLELIDDNPYQTRRNFNAEALAELAASIEIQGVLQPIVVRPAPPGAATEVPPGLAEGQAQRRYILVLGERRLRASRLAGRPTIPAIIERMSEQQAAEMTLVENLQRQDLNCIEQAEAFSNLSKRFNLTQEDIGERSGISREQVSNYMRLLSLPEGVIGALQFGRLTYSHARTLLHLKDKEEMWKFAKMAMDEKMSVARLEDLVLGASTSFTREPHRGGGARWVDPNVKAAQRSLETVLGVKVRIRDRKGKGKITIEYSTLEDFDRVVGMLKGDA